MLFLMDCGMRKKFVHHFGMEFTCNVLNTLFICFPTEVLHQVMLERSWPIVEVAGTGKGIKKLTEVVEKSTSKKSNST